MKKSTRIKTEIFALKTVRTLFGVIASPLMLAASVPFLIAMTASEVAESLESELATLEFEETQQEDITPGVAYGGVVERL